MKKRRIGFFISLTVVMGLVIGVYNTPAASKSYSLKLQSYYSPATIMGDKSFAKDIERMSGGRIKVTVFAGGELVSSDQILKAVKAGTVDMGHGFGGYYAELDMGVIEGGLPMSWKNATEVEIIYEDLGLLPLVAEAYEQAGVHYLGPCWAVPYAMLTKKPVRSLEDLRKMKIRTTAGTAKMLDKVGVSTVYLPPEEMYLALSTKQIDGIIYGSAAEYKLMGLYEVAPYYCTSYIFNPGVDSFFINKNIWNNLPDDLRAILESAVYRARYRQFSWMAKEEASVLAEIFKGKVTFLSDEDIATLTVAAMEVWEQEAAKSSRNAKAVDIIKKLTRLMGRLK